MVSSTQKRLSAGYYRGLGKVPKASYWIKLGSHAKYGNIDNLSRFIQFALPQIRWPFILYTSDGDSSVGDQYSIGDVRELLSSQFLGAWYAQNCCWEQSQDPEGVLERAVIEGKLRPIPIGLDFHTDRGLGIGKPVMQWWGRSQTCAREARVPKILVDLCAEPNCALRRDICRKLSSTPELEVLTERVPQGSLWDLYRKYAGVLSLPGHGADCHRTWEALYLGAIPVVRRFGVAPLYDGLPIIQLTEFETVEWSQVLQSVIAMQRNRSINDELITRQAMAKFGKMHVK